MLWQEQSRKCQDSPRPQMKQVEWSARHRGSEATLRRTATALSNYGLTKTYGLKYFFLLAADPKLLSHLIVHRGTAAAPLSTRVRTSLPVSPLCRKSRMGCLPSRRRQVAVSDRVTHCASHNVASRLNNNSEETKPRAKCRV